MPDLTDVNDRNLAPEQAAELALLVDLEARWENLRNAPRGPGGSPAVQDLHAKQKAYEAFRAKLHAYNKRYAPPHVPEVLLNTAPRLEAWCRRMRDLYAQVKADPAGPCPVHLVEKAYRWADRVAARTGRPCVERAPPPAELAAAIRELEAVRQWCEAPARVVPPAVAS